MYMSYFVNINTGETRLRIEPWLSPPKEWKQIDEEEWNLLKLIYDLGYQDGLNDSPTSV